MLTLLPGVRWCAAKDADPRGLALYRRHYSAKLRPVAREETRRKYTGPGEYMLLLTPQSDAIFLWRLERFRKDGQAGINCAIFRNESAFRASDLIQEACDLAWVRWPGERLWTYVNAAELPDNKRPGYCFECAGWTKLSKRSKGGLLIFEIAG